MRPTERARGVLLGAGVVAVLVPMAATAVGQVPPVGPTPTPPPSLSEPIPGPTPRSAAAALGVSMQGPARATVGQDLPYQATVSNSGSETVRGVVLTNAIPAGTVLGSVSTTQGDCAEDDPVVCDLGDLDPGATATVVVTVTAIRPGNVTNQASVTADNDPGGLGSVTTEVTGRACSVVGTADADELTGTDGDDVMCGLAGADRLEGFGGDDVIMGGSGDDTLLGVGGVDLLYGGGGNDTLAGADQDDYLDGGEGADSLDGGPGANTCVEAGTSCFGPNPEDGPDRGPLDVRSVAGPVGSVSFRIETDRGLNPRFLWDDGFFVVFLDTSGSSAPDRYAMAWAERSRLRGALFRYGSDGRPIASLRARAAGSHAVVIRVGSARLDLGSERSYFRWGAETIYTGRGCNPCFDEAPGGGLLPMPAPGA